MPSLENTHVVVLTNYLRRHHAIVFQEVAKHVGKLTILLSTEMEPDRSWAAEWGELDVQVQSNWMHTAKTRHSTGFEEPNFIHVPIDTIKRLRRLNPDIVFSYEMGMRSAFCGLFRLLRRHVPLVMVGNMADHIENERGPMRRLLRRFVRSRSDYATYNGPSCQRYLKQIGYRDDQLFHFPYCIDIEKTYTDPVTFNPDGHRHLIYTGMISHRKHIVPFTHTLRKYLAKDDSTTVTLSIAGTGPLDSEVAALGSERLDVQLLGNCTPDQLSAAYQQADICAFPTLGDEWGLVPIEAMASGIPVLGSVLSQSVEATVIESKNGWTFNPLQEQAMTDAIGRALRTNAETLAMMSEIARASVAHMTPQFSANRFCNVIREISGQPALSADDTRDSSPILAEKALL